VLRKAARCALLSVLAIVLPAVPLLGQTPLQDQRLKGQIPRASARGVALLEQSQLPTGEFPTYAWSIALGLDKKWPVRSVFTVTQLLHSLRFGDEGPAARRIGERAIAFLRAHQEPPGVWRYFGKGWEVRPGVLLSPDVDDTATAWAALLEHGLGVDPGAIAALRASRTETGLFTTWVGDPAGWTGIDSRLTDMVVNLNALFLFSLLGEPVPEVCRQAVAYTKSKAFLRGTPWYPSPLAYTYFLSRAYADGKAGCLEEAIPVVRSYVLARQRVDGGWGDDLETALGVLTLLNTGYRGPALRLAIETVLARQRPDGGWALAPHYTTVKPASEPAVYFGSPFLTTGFCLEALEKYLKR
jgi:prenyltransferase/squalene oxidase-like repeat protein